MNFTEEHITKLLAAIRFSAERHRNQRRKDDEATPYINHPVEVAELLWRIGGVRDTDVIIAALLHDLVEDTKTQPDEIAQEFGEQVMSLVLEVSDDKRLPKLERKRLQIAHAPGLSTGAKQIKLADKICNILDITHTPPQNWSAERKFEYLDWSAKVVEGLRGCNPMLEERFDRVLGTARDRIKVRT